MYLQSMMFSDFSLHRNKVFSVFLIFFLCTLSMTAYADDSSRIIDTHVFAAVGGTFSDDESNPQITITILPGALTVDARLRVKKKNNRKALKLLGDTQAASSQIYRVRLKEIEVEDEDENENRSEKEGGDKKDDEDKKLSLNQPMTIAIAADKAPIHPQLGEIARRNDGKWMRMQANFYRASSNTAVTQTTRTRGRYMVVHRTLQARTGPEVERGRTLYFDETWGDEAYWGDLFGLHHVLNAVDPVTAVGVGVQIDITKVIANAPGIAGVLTGTDYAAKQAALGSPAITRALIKADAVVGVKGTFGDPANPDMLTSVGLTCALCHVTVTPTEFQIAAPPADSTSLPIGFPVLGPPNASMNAGLILSFTPLVSAGAELPNKSQYESWGPGQFDPRFLPGNPLDDGVFNPSQIPQHWNYIDLAEQEYDITWPGILRTRPDNNSLGAGPGCGIDLVLGVNGAFLQPNSAISNFEIANPIPPQIIAALEQAEIDEPGTVLQLNDLLDLEAFLQSIVSPAPGPFDEVKAEAGMKLFYGSANCVACHSTAEGTGDQGYFTNIVANEPQGLLAIGIKTPALRGLTSTAPYFHDGSAATLADVVERYTSPEIPEVPASLTAADKEALVEYLKSM